MGRTYYATKEEISDFSKISNLITDDVIDNIYRYFKINDSTETQKREFRQYFLDLLLKSKQNDDISKLDSLEDFLESWMSLWPKGIKSSGLYIRSDFASVKHKMVRFIKNHPQYSLDLIYKATKLYLTEREINGWAYVKLAPYFIEKDNISVLASMCEAILSGASEESDDPFKHSI